MLLKTCITENNFIISIEGDLDACSSVKVDAILEQALSASKPNLLVDCQGLTYISSTGLGVFISYLHRLQALDIKLILFGMNDRIKSVFFILGLQKLIAVTETLDEANAICQVAETVI